MSRTLFASLPLHGHLDWGGMLRLAAALAARPGQAVLWVGGAAVEQTVTAAGVPFHSPATTGWQPLPPLPAGLSTEARQAERQRRALLSWLDPAAVLPAAAELRHLLAAWQPDQVAVEPYAVAAALAAEQLGLPLVVIGRPALGSSSPAVVTDAGRQAQMLCEAVGVAGDYWNLHSGQLRSPTCHIDFFCRDWYADLLEVGTQTHFCGGTWPALTLAQDDPPTVLITLGSLFNADDAFFRIATQAVLLAGAKPLLATGGRAAPAGLPAGVEVRGWVDFDQTLPRLAGIIHHGGVGTTHAALRHGLPQIVVPHAGDQLPQAARVTSAQVGYGVQPANFTLAAARWLVNDLLKNAALRRRARQWQRTLNALGGVGAARRCLEG